MSALVSVKHVSKQYRQQGEALHDVSFDLQAGQVLGLLGPVSYTHLTLPTT